MLIETCLCMLPGVTRQRAALTSFKRFLLELHCLWTLVYNRTTRHTAYVVSSKLLLLRVIHVKSP